MADIDGKSSLPWAQPERPRLHRSKAQIYETLSALNRGFEETLGSLERLAQFNLFSREALDTCKIGLELSRAQANEAFLETLHEDELGDAARVYRLARGQESRDPDDVLFAARYRRREIKAQIRELQKSLRK